MKTLSTPRTPHSARQGFTLIELLVVIAIIAILSSIMLAGVTSSLNTAKRRKATVEAENIANAIMVYFNDNNGRLPISPAYQTSDSPAPTGTDPDFSESKDVIQVLTATADTATMDDLNPKRTVYLSTDTSEADGTLLDPWGTQYYIMLDRDYDGAIDYLNQSGEAHRKKAVVISAGKDEDFGSGTNSATRDNAANVTLAN